MSSGRKKGLSLEEKRKKACEFFFETADFFQLKELEKLLPKQKGITSQSVKEVIEGLVAGQQRKRRLLELEQESKSKTDQLTKLESTFISLSKSKQETDESIQLKQKLDDLIEKVKEQEQELKKYDEFDPIVLKQKDETSKEFKKHANRWTDNIFLLRSFCFDSFNMESGMFDKSFDIPADFDTLE